MAHSSLHFAFGMSLGSLVTVPPLLCAWARREPLSAKFRNWFLASYAAGSFAVIPGVMRRLGVSDAVCDGWWMNIFLLYPAINHIKDGGMTMGPLLMGGILGVQYLALIIALAVQLRRQQRKNVLD